MAFSWQHRLATLGSEFANHMSKLEGIEEDSYFERYNWAVELKDLGNGLFYERNFIHASLVYETILDVLIPFLASHALVYVKFQALMESCFLNLAASYLQLQEYDQVISLTSHVLTTDRKSAKGLFRRGQAFEKKGDLLAAVSDYDEALCLEPSNVTLKKAALEVRSLLSSHDGVSRDCLGACSEERVLGEGCLANGGCSFTDSKIRVDLDRGGKQSKRTAEEMEVGAQEGVQPKKKAVELRNLDEGGLRSIGSAPSLSLDFASTKEVVRSSFAFRNRRNRSRSLNIPSRAYNKLMAGHEIYFSNAASFSFLTIRVVRKAPILAETLQVNHAWEAAVSISSDSPSEGNVASPTQTLLSTVSPPSSDFPPSCSMVEATMPPIAEMDVEEIAPADFLRPSSSDVEPISSVAAFRTDFRVPFCFSSSSPRSSRICSTFVCKTSSCQVSGCKTPKGKGVFSSLCFCRVMIGCKRKSGWFVSQDSCPRYSKKLLFDWPSRSFGLYTRFSMLPVI